MFEIMAVSKIVETEGTPKLTDEYFESKLDAIGTAVDQYASKPLSFKIRHEVSGKELDVWAPELSSSGSFVQVCYSLQDDHRTKDYYIAARAALPGMVQDLKKKIAQEKPTYMQLVVGDEWSRRLQFAAYASKRNVYRAIANTAEACGVEVVRMDDSHPKLDSPNHAPPEMAVPEWEQKTNTISAVSHDSKPAVMFTYGVVPASECLLLEQNHFFVVSSPYDGIAVFDLSDHGKILAAGGIPSDTGRKVAPEKLGSIVASNNVSNRTQGVTWEKKNPKQQSHTDLHPDAFNPLGAQFKDGMKRMGWNAENHVKMLVRVASKIHNPAIGRRK